MSTLFCLGVVGGAVAAVVVAWPAMLLAEWTVRRSLRRVGCKR